MENPIMTLTMEDGGKIVAELYPEKAPQSVRNFISLANKGFKTKGFPFVAAKGSRLLLKVETSSCIF